ncbi:MAG: SDR family oxidoreductase [Gemmatimonadales bacterium]
MILVVGATGHLGGEICRRLTAGGRPVRALVRPTSAPEAVSHLRASGAQLIEGDLRDPASLLRATRGATAVISTATVTRSRQPGDSIEATDMQGQEALVEAARQSGVGHLVYVSYSGRIGGDDPLTLAKRNTETRLKASGLAYTILRPSYFMEVWLSPALGFDYSNRRATIYGDGTAPISWIALGDVAEFAVQSLTNEAARNAALELGGPEALSPIQVVHLFEEAAGGASFELQYVPVATLEAQRAAASDSLQRAFASLMLAYAKGNPISMEATLARFPVPLISVREYVRRVLGA